MQYEILVNKSSDWDSIRDVVTLFDNLTNAIQAGERFSDEEADVFGLFDADTGEIIGLFCEGSYYVKAQVQE